MGQIKEVRADGSIVFENNISKGITEEERLILEISCIAYRSAKKAAEGVTWNESFGLTVQLANVQAALIRSFPNELKAAAQANLATRKKL